MVDLDRNQADDGESRIESFLKNCDFFSLGRFLKEDFKGNDESIITRLQGWIDATSDINLLIPSVYSFVHFPEVARRAFGKVITVMDEVTDMDSILPLLRMFPDMRSILTHRMIEIRRIEEQREQTFAQLSSFCSANNFPYLDASSVARALKSGKRIVFINPVDSIYTLLQSFAESVGAVMATEETENIDDNRVLLGDKPRTVTLQMPSKKA